MVPGSCLSTAPFIPCLGAISESRSPCWAKLNSEPDCLASRAIGRKRLLLLLAPVVLADPAIDFDGGGIESEEKIEVPTDQ